MGHRGPITMVKHMHCNLELRRILCFLFDMYDYVHTWNMGKKMGYCG